MEKPLISVIIPVYTPGVYLDSCLQSIQAQTYPNFEVILVDNGSTDGSAQRCDEWVRQDSHFRVIHQQNEGIIGGRGTGIRMSRGEYLAFVDSDDLIHPQMLEILIDSCLAADIPCAGCGLVPFFGAVPAFKPLEHPACKCYPAPNHLDALLHCNRMQYSLCNKLYHRSLFNGLSFDSKIMYNEDLFTNWTVLQHASGFVLVDFDGYFYRQHTSSTSHKPPSDKLFSDQISVAEFMRDSSKGTAMAASAWAFYYEKLLYLNSMILRRRNAKAYTGWHKILVHRLRKELFTALISSELSSFMKLTAILSCFGGPFYRLLCRLFLTDRRE